MYELLIRIETVCVEAQLLTLLGVGAVATVAGLLLFGVDPQAFLSRSYITIVRFRGRDTAHGYYDRRDLLGTLPDVVDAAWDGVGQRVPLVDRGGAAGASLAGYQWLFHHHSLWVGYGKSAG